MICIAPQKASSGKKRTEVRSALIERYKTPTFLKAGEKRPRGKRRKNFHGRNLVGSPPLREKKTPSQLSVYCYSPGLLPRDQLSSLPKKRSPRKRIFFSIQGLAEGSFSCKGSLLVGRREKMKCPSAFLRKAVDEARGHAEKKA